METWKSYATAQENKLSLNRANAAIATAINADFLLMALSLEDYNHLLVVVVWLHWIPLPWKEKGFISILINIYSG